MDKNVSNSDRMIRVVLGSLVIGLGAYYQSLWGVVGLVGIVTGLMNWCPGYALLGISTNKTKQAV